MKTYDELLQENTKLYSKYLRDKNKPKPKKEPANKIKVCPECGLYYKGKQCNHKVDQYTKKRTYNKKIKINEEKINNPDTVINELKKFCDLLDPNL